MPPSRIASTSNELVQVILKLEDLNRADRNSMFFRQLAETLTDPAEIALLCEMAEEEGGHQFALQLGKMASYRNLPVHSSAFPTSAIPSSAKTGAVEKPMVYAIARQESAFNPAAVSSAGARGLLQLMPATAKAMAKAVGVTYSQDRLTSDPAYNAQLGAAIPRQAPRELRRLLRHDLRRLQCRPSRVTAWVKQYGDPRDPDVDVGQLDRAHPLHRDAQLRPAHHGEHAGLPRPARRAGAHHRVRPEARPGDRLAPAATRLRQLLRRKPKPR